MNPQQLHRIEGAARQMLTTDDLRARWRNTEDEDLRTRIFAGIVYDYSNATTTHPHPHVNWSVQLDTDTAAAVCTLILSQLNRQYDKALAEFEAAVADARQVP